MQALASEVEYKSLKSESNQYPSHTLTERQICDLELILNGGFNPLKGYLNQDDYQSVLDNMRLQDGSVWPMPITLDVHKEFSDLINISDKITLRDKEGFPLAILDVESIWVPNKDEEAQKVFGTTESEYRHPKKSTCIIKLSSSVFCKSFINSKSPGDSHLLKTILGL